MGRGEQTGASPDMCFGRADRTRWPGSEAVGSRLKGVFGLQDRGGEVAGPGCLLRGPSRARAAGPPPPPLGHRRTHQT